MKKDILREFFSIPNLLGYLRIALIPLYLYIYLNARELRDYYYAAGVMSVSFLSDLFDGKIARRFNMVTEFGKLLDPVADKLTQAALAVSFAFRFPIMRLLFAALVIKDGTLLILGIYFFRHGMKVLKNGAQMHGKVCTFVMDISMLLILFMPGTAYGVVIALTALSLLFMGYSFYRYLMEYAGAFEELKKKKKEI